MKNVIPSDIFSTEDYEKNDRLDVYRESMGVIFDTENYSQPSKSFHASIKSYLISEIMLIECKTDGQHFNRSNSKIASDSLDHFLVQYFFTGGTYSQQKAGEVFCKDDLLLVMDGSLPWQANNSDFKNLTLVIPRRLLAPKLNNEYGQHGKIMDPAKNPFANILKAHMLSIYHNVEKMDSSFAADLVSPTVDLTASAMNYQPTGCQLDQNNPSHKAALKIGIRYFIDRNLKDPNLSLERILSEFNLKRSTLYRLFSTPDGGIVKYIRNRRLQMAYRQLATASSTKQTISQVAFEYGFENISSFNRAFKSYFRELPSDVVQHRKPPISSVSGGNERVWESWFKIL